MSEIEQSLKINTELFGSNAIYIAEIYEQFLRNPNSVDESWRVYFAELGDNIAAIEGDFGGGSWSDDKTRILGYAPKIKADAKGVSAKADAQDSASALSIKAHMLIRAFRVRGHLLANLDPLGLEHKEAHPELDPARYGFAEDDYDTEIFLGGWLGKDKATLREILAILKQSYSENFAIEFIHIQSLTKKEWLEERIENSLGRPNLSADEKKSILKQLVEIVGFEEFLHIKYPGAKRFSIEGGENLIPAMEAAVEISANLGVKEVVLGMPHRGRLNVLTAFMQKSYQAMLSEFEGNLATPDSINISGDVKYHLGISADRNFKGYDGVDKEVHLSLTANPSHLEAVNPVVVGKVRAKQDQHNDSERSHVMGVLLHGDAAFCGQGVVAETLSLNDLEGYKAGGTIHFVVNNQIGFTTNPENQHTSPYPTDVAMMIQAPIFHVNGDDPEAVVHAARIAAEYRQTFKKDVVIDIFCYRKHGHNEGDEPMFTQPIMYKTIKNKQTPREVYAQRLISEGVITQQEFDQMKADFHKFLDGEHEASQSYKPSKADMLEGKWQGLEKVQNRRDKTKTGITLKKLKELGAKLAHQPDGVEVNGKIKRMLGAKAKMIETGKGLDWALGEGLAFASLLDEGVPVRISGQDVMRGTFSHRHSAFVDQNSEELYWPLNNLSQKQARYEAVNSNLSEFAVLGYEYGYSSAEPNALTIWEAQFGDFANGAQTIIDQFISSAESKWLRMSGLVMLLPHGYEGQGPEHSSGRMERYLQMSAEDNWIIANCTTPASFFHILRRQIKRTYRKPLIVFTPKSLLRHKLAKSDLAEFSKGETFHCVIPETDKLAADSKIRKVVFCTGKIYYDLYEERAKRKINDVALIRLEQIYPFPSGTITKNLARYKNAQIIWCQEEPKNMGAWSFVDRPFEDAAIAAKHKNPRPEYVGRKASASTAAGYMKIHKIEQDMLIKEALK